MNTNNLWDASDQNCVMVLVEDREAVEARVLGQGDTFEVVSLSSMEHDDTRIYAEFVVHSVDDAVMHTSSVVAYDRYGNALPLPRTVKSYYQSLEAARAVRQLLAVFATGKTIGQCNMLVADYDYRERNVGARTSEEMYRRG